MGKNACLGGQRGGSSQWPSCAGEDWRSSLGPLAPGTQTAARRPVDELLLGQIKHTEKNTNPRKALSVGLNRLRKGHFILQQRFHPIIRQLACVVRFYECGPAQPTLQLSIRDK